MRTVCVKAKISGPRKIRLVSIAVSTLLLLVFLGDRTALSIHSPYPVSSAQTTSLPIWATIQHDFQRTSVASAPGPTTNSTDWTFGPTGSIQSSPAIGSDGTIYVVDSNFRLFAINPDGSIKWEKTFNEGLFSPAIAPDGTIYVPGTRHLFAFYPDGSSPWTVPYNLSTSRSSALAISPQGLLFEIDSNGTLHAINPFGTTATSVWALHVSCIPATLALAPSGALYCGTNTNGTGALLEAINPNGQLQWSYPTQSIVLVPPTIDPDGNLYVVSSGGEVFALNPSGGLEWEIRNIHQEVTSAVIGPSDTIYVAGNKLAAISQSGTELWTEFCYVASNSLCYPFGVVTSMAVDSNGILYMGTNSSGLIALNAEGGLVWAYTTIPTGEGSLSPIAIGDNGTMYVGDGCLFCNVTAYGHLLAIGQPNGYTSFSVEESGLPAGNSWSFLVNGENYSTTGNSLDFSLPSGSFSWASPSSPVPNTVGVRYASSILQGTFTVPTTTNVTLSYSIEYQLNITAYPSVGGTVFPSSGTWYTPGATVQLNASAHPEYDFGVWSTSFGSITATNPSAAQSSVVINGPGSILGIFDPLVTVSVGSGGSVVFLDPPNVGTLQSGQSISFYAPSESVLVLTARPSSGFSFQSWSTNSSLGIDPFSSILQFKIASPATLTAQFSPSTVTSSTTSAETTSSTITSASTISSTVRAPSIPSTSTLPTRNLALDAAGAFIIVLAILLGVVVVMGFGRVRRETP
jgi:hypothetical protein